MMRNIPASKYRVKTYTKTNIAGINKAKQFTVYIGDSGRGGLGIKRDK